MIQFRLDPRSGVSTYLQLVQQVRHALRLGMLRPGDQLLVVQKTGNLLRIPAEECAIAAGAVGRAHTAFQSMGGVADAPAGVLFFNQARQAVLFLPARLFEGSDLRGRVLALAGNGVRVSRV